MNIRVCVLSLSAVLLIAPVLGQSVSPTKPPVNSTVTPTITGIAHFAHIADYYYRGGQPDDNGLRQLAQKGVRTIVDLRGEDKDRDDHERQIAESVGMQYINIPLSTIHAPSDEQVSRFLAIVHSSENQPVFVHCRRGSDRTGVMTAIVRINDFNWTADQAYHEMKEYGFRSFLLPTMKRYVYKYADEHLHTQTKPEASDGRQRSK
ncbi:MAG TPA: tyrosine-protein phosphatase [Blastocatellia bacterium]|nr:tyrosine-protein phosphatase [Blastocatellia bacterium]